MKLHRTDAELANALDERYHPVREPEVSIGEIKERMNCELCLPVEGKFGYVEHIWFPEMTEDELEDFWRNMKLDGNGHWNRNDHGFPGSFLSVYDYVLKDDYGHLYDDKGVDSFIELYNALRNRPSIYRARIWSNSDSFLVTPKLKAIFHKSHNSKKERKSVKAWVKRERKKGKDSC